MLAVGGLCVFVQGERIAAQKEADALAANLERAQAAQRELIVELSRAEMPDEMLRRAAVAGMVEPGPVAAVPSAPIPATGIPATEIPATEIAATEIAAPASGMPVRAG